MASRAHFHVQAASRGRRSPPALPFVPCGSVGRLDECYGFRMGSKLNRGRRWPNVTLLPYTDAEATRGWGPRLRLFWLGSDVQHLRKSNTE